MLPHIAHQLLRRCSAIGKAVLCPAAIAGSVKVEPLPVDLGQILYMFFTSHLAGDGNAGDFRLLQKNLERLRIAAADCQMVVKRSIGGC